MIPIECTSWSDILDQLLTLTYIYIYTVEPRVSGQKVGNLLFSFKNIPAYRGAIRLAGNSTEYFFLLSNMLFNV